MASVSTDTGRPTRPLSPGGDGDVGSPEFDPGIVGTATIAPDTFQPASSSTGSLEDAALQLHALELCTRRQLLRVLAEMGRREVWRRDGCVGMPAWVAMRLDVAAATAKELVRAAEALEDLPAIAGGLESGLLSWDKVAALTSFADPGTDERLAEDGQGLSVAQLQGAARRARKISLAEVRAADRSRRLGWRWDPRGRMLDIWARIPDADGLVVIKALERLADQTVPALDPEITGSYAARCADALVELCSTSLNDQADADRATIVVHVDDDVLSGVTEGTADADEGVVLAGETARRLACDANVEFVLDDTDGRPIGIGRRTRSVPGWLTRQLRHRDEGCRFPGCGRKRWVHAHHVVHWASGGPTDRGNLVLLCSRHHRMLHEGGWSLRGDPEDRIEFVRPDGRVLYLEPEPLRGDIKDRLGLDRSDLRSLGVAGGDDGGWSNVRWSEYREGRAAEP